MAVLITCKAERLLFLLLLNMLVALLHATTNEPDVSALQNLFISLESSTQLSGWSSNGSDPCGDLWGGVTCLNQAVTEIHLSGLNLTGSLGYRLDQLTSLTILDLSNNQLSGGLPYQLPPNVQQLNLGNNNFSGGSGSLPYSFMAMTHLASLNMSHNQFSGNIDDVFWHLQNLITLDGLYNIYSLQGNKNIDLDINGFQTLDLSFNNFTGDLPQSFSNLSVLSVMYLQNNALSGDLNVLANLPLQDLNVENNQFSGWIPSTIGSIPDLKLRGNQFNAGPAPPPPPFVPPPPGMGQDRTSGNNGSSAGDLSQQSSPINSSVAHSDAHSGLSSGAVTGIAIASVLSISIVTFIIIFFCLKRQEYFGTKEKHQSVTSSTMESFIMPPAKVSVHGEDKKLEMYPQKVTLKPPPAEVYKRVNSKEYGKKSPRRKERISIATTAYPFADLQVATNSFHGENLMGVGTYGRVYKAKLHDQVVAVKKLDASNPDFPKGDEITELVSNISRLHHPNITQLVGYCVEYGQCLLVYDYYDKGTLHDMLHSDDEMRKELTWNARVKIALGAARALEYLHEVCLPPVVHKNFKSANILLDEELNPCLSDSGIAAFLQSSERQVSAYVTGSFSYSAPEHAMSGVYTTKSDVYGFGVVMLELLTGRKAFDSTKPRNEKSLVRWATPQLHDIDALTSMVDPPLMGQYPVKSLSRFADVISLCVQLEPEFRPLMSEVVQSLVRLLQRASLSKKA